MSTFRQRWRLVVDGQTLEVTTCAWDNVGLTIPVSAAGEGAIPWEMAYRVVHNACIRTEQPVPRSFKEFCLVLDDADTVDDEDVAGGEAGEDTDPTRLVPSDA